MIGFLRGRVLECTAERLLLDVNGVGYELLIPQSTYAEIESRDRSDSIGLQVHTHVREGAIELFGFWTQRERLLFEALIGVSGIGPRLARAALSGMDPDQIVMAIADANNARLATIPGIGKKTAARIIVELKDRIGELASELPTSNATPVEDELLPALLALGYRNVEAERALAEARKQHPDADSQQLLKNSLKLLSRS